MKRTPIEQAINAAKDRRRKHDKEQRKVGLIRVTVTVPGKDADALRTIARTMTEGFMRDWLAGRL